MEAQQPHYIIVERPRNGLGIFSLVMGLGAIIWVWFIITWPIVIPAAIAGLWTGIYGIRRAKAGTASNPGVTWAGVVLSAITLGLVLILAVISFISSQ